MSQERLVEVPALPAGTAPHEVVVTQLVEPVLQRAYARAGRHGIGIHTVRSPPALGMRSAGESLRGGPCTPLVTTLPACQVPPQQPHKIVAAAIAMLSLIRHRT